MATLEMTNVRLCTGVPLDNTYTDTLTFGSAAAQQSYFAGKTKITQVNLSYQREGMFIRWQGVYDTIIDCNYVCYQNQAFGGKWFYAFITKIEYQNDLTSYIYFEVDAYQTFMFDVQIKSCFVEREHVADDTIGANTLPEPIETGDYKTMTTYKQEFNSWWIVVGATVDLDESDFPNSGITRVAGMYSGLGYYVFDNIPALQALLFDALVAKGKLEAVKSMYMIPKATYPNGTSGSKMSGSAMTPTQDTIGRPTTLDGYVPMNNKLLTFPYCVCELSNLSGNAVALAFEYFGDTVTFETFGSPMPSGSISLYPVNYLGYVKAYDFGVSISNYPVMGWTGDDFSNWLALQAPARAAQNAAMGLNITTKTLTGIVPKGFKAVNGADAISGAVDIVNTLVARDAETITHSMLPDSYRGNAGGETTRISQETYGFQIRERTMRKEWAIVADEFFNKNGYNVSRVKVPNITGRPSWNFVKTRDAIVVGKCPAPYIDTIKAMLNRGVTFWHGDWVGDYSRPNKAV